MISVSYIFKDNKGELDLENLSSFQSKEEILDSIHHDEFKHCVIEDTLKHLAPDIETNVLPRGTERGGSRYCPSEISEKAQNIGFSKLVAKIDKEVIKIVD